MAVKVNSLSKQYVRAEVQAKLSGAYVNPTADVVEMAFPAVTVDPSVWVTASWETDATASPTRYYARCLVGPSGAITLTDGLYDCWVRVTDSPEIPVMKAGQVEVF